MSKDWTLGNAFALLGTSIECAVVVGIAFTLYQSYGVFREVQISESGDAEGLAGSISTALVPTMFGLIVGATGNLISFLTAILSTYRSKWFFWWSFSFSVVYIFNMIGLAFMVFLLVKRKEFLASDSQPHVSA